eukprot:7591581-Pyramimonas_sp.AAC.1
MHRLQAHGKRPTSSRPRRGLEDPAKALRAPPMDAAPRAQSSQGLQRPREARPTAAVAQRR